MNYHRSHLAPAVSLNFFKKNEKKIFGKLREELKKPLRNIHIESKEQKERGSAGKREREAERERQRVRQRETGEGER